MAIRKTKKNQLILKLEDISIEGSIIAPEYMVKIAQNKAIYQTEDDYLIDKGLTLREEVVRYYKIASQIWKQYYCSKQDIEAIETYFPILLKRCFGFETIARGWPQAYANDVKTDTHLLHKYPVRWFAQDDRIPIVFCRGDQDLDKAYKEFGDEYRARSPFALLQEYLNASAPALWGIVTNGKVLRIARDNLSLTRPAFIEIDFEHIFNTDKYSEFNIAWMILHETRFGKARDLVSDCALEHWRTEGQKMGSRVRENLRLGVESAVKTLGQAFLKEPSNTTLRAKLAASINPGNPDVCSITAQDYYNQLLRMIYRIIFLIAAEERDVLHPHKCSKAARQLYEQSYSMRFLRERAARRLARDRHTDLYEIVRIVFKSLEFGQPKLALPALGGLFAHEQCPDLIDCKLQNMDLLEAIYPLMWMREGTQLARINWRDMDTEELGSVYEGLLEVVPVVSDDGHMFGFADETAGNERKITGSYYTPPSLVKVIIDNALTPVIERTLARHPSEPDKALLKLTVCDPACGSGHFLLAAVRKLANEIARLRTNGAPSAEDFRTAVREVIGKCIYGVDVNPMAVELCRVALWMEALKPGMPLTFLDSHIQCGNSLLGTTEDAVEEGIPDDAWELMKGDDKKIANALKKRNKDEREKRNQGWLFAPQGLFSDKIAGTVQEIDDLSDATLEDVKTKATQWHRYKTTAEYTVPKRLCDIWSAAFLWPKTTECQSLAPTYRAFEQIKKNPQSPCQPQFEKILQELVKKHRIFHWHLEFPQIFKNGGFDCILANPPYIQLQSMSVVNNLMRFNQPNTYDSSGDIYCLFYERAMQMLKDKCYAGILTSNKWMRAGYGQKIRSYFATKTNPTLLVDFSGLKLFEAATVDVNILCLQKAKNDGKTQTCIMKEEGVNQMGIFIQQNGSHTAYDDPDGNSWAILSPIERAIKAKIEAVGTPLKDWDVKIYRGILTGCNEAFIIDEAKRNEILSHCKTDDERERTEALIRPILRGRDIKRYKAEWAGLYVLNVHNGIKEKNIPPIDIQQYPAIKSHLDQYWDKISKRDDKGVTPYHLRNCAYLEDFLKQKIIYPNMTKFLPFYLDNYQYYTNQKCFFITGKRLSFLTAFLNSSLFKFCFKNSFPELLGETRELSKIFFDKIPVVEVSDAIEQDFSKLVNDIQQTYSKQKAIHIDQVIFDLYGLTEDERAAAGFIEL